MRKIKTYEALAVLILTFLCFYQFYGGFKLQSKRETKSPVSLNEAKGKYFYWIFTTEENHEARCKGIIQTWGNWVKNLTFISTVESDLPSIAVHAPENFLDKKELLSWKLVYEKYYSNFDWFIKGDDDTFFVVPNLESFLSQLDPNQPYYLGRRFLHEDTKIVYASGGAGYVLSKKALQILYKNMEKCLGSCKNPGQAGDFAIGKCLKQAGIIMSETRDELRRERFHPFTPSHHLFYDFEEEHRKGAGWYRKASWYGLNEFGPNCCPPSTISFHYIDTENMKEFYDVLEGQASFLDFGDFSSLEIDTSGKSVHVQTTLFKPQDCFKRCEKKFQISNQLDMCKIGCEIYFYGITSKPPLVSNCNQLNQTDAELAEICFTQMWPFDKQDLLL